MGGVTAASCVLTSTAVGELDRICKVRSSVIALISVSGLVVSDELGVDVNGGDIVYDAADLKLGVLE